MTDENRAEIIIAHARREQSALERRRHQIRIAVIPLLYCIGVLSLIEAAHALAVR